MSDESVKENLANTSMDSDLNEPEAKKRKVETDASDNQNESVGNDNDLASTHITPSRKTKMSMEEREAEKQKKLEIKRQKEEDREKIKAEKIRLAEEKRQEKDRKEKEREEKKKEEERKKEERRELKRAEEEEKLRKKEEKEKKKKEEEAKKREDEERKEAKKREEEQKKKRESNRIITCYFPKQNKESAEEDAPKPMEKLWYKPFTKPKSSAADDSTQKKVSLEWDILSHRDDVDKTTYLLSDAVKKRQLSSARIDKTKAKLFQFHDNFRPPYYGSWRKRDNKVNPRNPLKKTSDTIDYDFNSDEEWEEEPSDAEECKSDEEDLDVDEQDSDADEFMVEPGYLSDGEGQDDSEEPTERDAEGRAERLAARATEWKRNVLNKSKLVHECQVQLALFRHATQGIGTAQDGASLRREVETAGRACLKACEAARNCVLPQLRNEGVEFTRHASQFIGCVAAYVVEMKRCVALERTFPAPTEPSITPQMIANMESMLENLENLITVHFSTSESTPADKVSFG